MSAPNESEDAALPRFPRIRLLQSPPRGDADSPQRSRTYHDSLIETQVALLRLLNAYPYANLDDVLISRIAYVISVSVNLPGAVATHS